MSNLAEARLIGVDEYLDGEERASVRHEYVAGEVFAMAGATDAHATIALNLAAMLRAHVRGSPCRVYIAEMKLRVAPASAFFYPDLFVTCEPADADAPLFKAHARVVVEVLSASTACYDRTDKFDAYRRLPSLEKYVLIDSRSRAVEVFERHPEGWLLRPLSADGRLTLASIGFACELDAVYEDVAVAPPAAGADESTAVAAESAGGAG